ncbi:MAG TPA: PLP-dependent aminotransferase family protein [Galbitalea sp.]|jgi:GntR family transcriptional regulator/MocR family aminotransferase
MDVHVSLGPTRERTESIYRQLSAAIVEGRLAGGEPLPASRVLAAELGVSRTTVAAVYDRLVAEGFTVTRPGAGTFVAPGRATVTPRRAPRGRTVAARAVWSGMRFSSTEHVRAPFDFGIGVPDPQLFPLVAWRRNVARELRSASALVDGYGHPAGLPRLRTAIARHVALARSVRAGSDDVIVTAGAQQAFDLTARILVVPGDVVAVEEPGYPPVRALFTSLGATVVGVRVDELGLVVSELPARAKLVYTTPSHQFPTGVRMSLDRRLELLAWAESANAVIIEDDYDSEFHYGAGALDPLQVLDRSGRVIYIGTFSKTLLPTLRIGFLVAPASLIPALTAAKRLSDWNTEIVGQGALAELIDSGTFAASVRRSNRVYSARRWRIIDGIGRELDRWLEVVPSVAGLHLFAQLRPGVPLRVQDVRDAAAAAGVGIQSVASFAVHPDANQARRGFVLGYGIIDEDGIDRGLHRLGDVLTRLT